MCGNFECENPDMHIIFAVSSNYISANTKMIDVSTAAQRVGVWSAARCSSVPHCGSKLGAPLITLCSFFPTAHYTLYYDNVIWSSTMVIYMISVKLWLSISIVKMLDIYCGVTPHWVPNTEAEFQSFDKWREFVMTRWSALQGMNTDYALQVWG